MMCLVDVPQCGPDLLPADRTDCRRGGGPSVPGGSFLEVHACGPPDVMA